MKIEPAAASSNSAGSVSPRWKLAIRFAEPVSVLAVFGFMLYKSWLRWLDPLTDFPRDLYFAWRISEGDLLYEKLANWYGPLPNLTEAVGFRLFGVGLDTVVWMNILLTLIILFLLREIFGAVGNRLTVWLCSMFFVMVFAVNRSIDLGNLNFIAPYVAQSTYGFAGLLLVLWGLLREIKSRRPVWLGVVGLGLVVAYLDKPEPLLAALGALAVCLVARTIHWVRWSAPPFPRRRVLTAAIWLIAGFFALWLPVFLFFLAKGGLAYAILATDYVPHSLLDSSIQHAVGLSPFNQTLSGFDRPGANIQIQLIFGGLLVLVCELLVLLSWGWTRAQPYGPAWWIRLIFFIAVAACACVGNFNIYFFWIAMGRAISFPVIVAAAAVVWWTLWSAWHDRASFSHTLGVAVIGVAAALMLARMILNVTLNTVGFFMTPLAVFFLIHLMVVEASRPGPGSLRANWLLPAVFAGIVLFGSGVLGWASLDFYAGMTLPVGSGRDHFYTSPLERSPAGPILHAMIDGVKARAPAARTLVAFPEGISANYQLRIPSPLAELELHPLALGYAGGPAHVLQELQAHPPDVIFLHYRANFQHDFGLKYFGDTEAGGSEILAWINEHYRNVANAGNATDATSTGHIVDMYLPKDVPNQAASGAPAPSPPRVN